MVKTSFVFAAIFGLSSIAYALSENKLRDALSRENAISALKVTIEIDKLTLADEIRKHSAKCNYNSIADTCSDYIQGVVQARNRIKDYKILLSKSLGFSDESIEVRTLENKREEINNLTQIEFGTSLSKAKDMNILSISQYINHVSSKEKVNNRDFRRDEKDFDSLYNIFMESVSHIEKNILGAEFQDKRVNRALAELKTAFYFLLTIEIIVFSIVNIIDILNNNADPENFNEFSFSKIQPKTKPLMASVFLAFFYMITAQMLLIRETERSLLSNCRELNKQNIGFMANIDSHQSNINNTEIFAYFEPKPECQQVVKDFVDTDLQNLNNHQETSYPIIKEIESMKLRIYADGYQDAESNFDNITSNLLLSLLIMNVATLASLAVFLKYDSQDIG